MSITKNIEIKRITYLRGPNIWTYRPVIEAWVDIGDLENHPSNTLSGLYERLTAWLPGLIEHRCSPGVRGGFLQRLQEGTWAAHILEHVTLELQNLSGMQTGFGKARQMSQPGHYKVAFRTRQEQVGRAALLGARDLLCAAINDTPYDLSSTLQSLREMVDSLCLGPSTSHIVDAATARGIPHIRLTDGNLVQLGYGSQQRRIWTAETDQTSAIAEEIASDKSLTKNMLESCGIPVPTGQTVDNIEQAWEVAQDVGLPVAVKPLDGNHGRGVSLDLQTETDIKAAFTLAAQHGNGVIVERFIPGNEHRLLVVGNQVVAAACGEAIWVEGDGVSSINTLADLQINSDPRRGENEDAPLNLLIPSQSEEVMLELQRVGLTPNSIPAKGQRVLMSRNGNVATDITAQVHPSVAYAAALAARVVGLDIAGIDMVLEDVSKPLNQQRGAVIEVNASPGLLAHIKPAKGTPQPVGHAIIHHLFAAEQNGRIPVIGINGSHHTGRLARLTAWLIQISGKKVGIACSEGLYLDNRLVRKQHADNWHAGQQLLLNRNLDAAVIENGNYTILAEGLSYDKCAVGVVTDLVWTPALAEFDIQDTEQTIKVARTQVDVVLPSGCAVLNADDPLVAQLAELCDGDVIFYAMDGTHPELTRHRTQGRRVVFHSDDTLILAHGDKELAQLPLSLLKKAKAEKPQMVMAAIAAAWAANVPTDLIIAGLRTFDSNPKKTPY